MIAARLTAIALCLSVSLSLALATVQAATMDSDTVVVKDPHYGEVLFFFYQEDYFPAIVRLLAAQKKARVEQHVDEAELLRGGLYLSYGNHLEAAAIFERLLAGNVSPEVRDRTWFFLAKIWYQRGYLDESQQALDNIKAELPKNLRREALMLQAQILIDTLQFDRAIALLQQWDDNSDWAGYAKFNLGVAMVRSGRVDSAAQILDGLGSISPNNEELTSLRDKANLALGYALIQDGQATAAKAPLQRVRLEGPFSNKALLGVGWADAELERYHRALVPWMELRGRDLLDSAVQESMLAIPYALAKLDSISQSADHYLNAIEAFFEEINRIDRTIANIESGDLFDEFLADEPLDSKGWYWRLEGLPEGPEGRYLYRLLATHKFQEGLKNYRDLGYLYRNLDDWQQSIDIYGNMLDTRRLAYEARVPRSRSAIGRADLDSLIDRKLEFDSTLNNIEQSGDWLALASEREFQMWGEIARLESAPALASDLPEAAEVRMKLRLLHGVLKWRLERDFKDRLWRIRRSLRQTGEALVQTQRSRRQVDQSMRSQPLDFDGLSRRVHNLEPRITGLKIRVADTMVEQRAYLQSIAIGELRARKERLDIYTVQARFALAAIYDLAATVGEVTE